jgi:NitT/TauT family transport system substrate-binding protein
MEIDMIRKGMFALISLIFMSQACKWSTPIASTPEPSTSQTPPRKIVVILLCCYLSDSGFLVAQEKGFFTEQGLEVELVRNNSSSEGMAAMLSGQADIWGGGIDPGIFNAIARGDGLKLIADKGQVPTDCNYMSMAVRKEELNKYSQIMPAQLENARIAASGTQTGSYYVDAALMSVGASLTELNTTDIPAANRLESLLSGSVDISLISEPWITYGIESEEIALWKPAEDLLPHLQISTWIASSQALKNKPDDIQRFVTAYLKGVHLVNQGKTSELVDMIAKGTKMEPSLVDRVCLPGLSDDGKVNIKSIDEYQEWLISKGWLDSKVSPDRYWDDSFVEKAQQILEQESK